tara:strand:- start:583 stop:816 length:234 start_codon:yes stop_codon:yes gene_type:complete
MVKKKIINNIDKFFLLLDIIDRQVAEQGRPDESFLAKINSLAVELTPSESDEVMHKYFQGVIKRDFFGKDDPRFDLQ